MDRVRRSPWRRLSALVVGLLAAAGAGAADQPYALADIALAASYRDLAAALDFRDIHAAVAEQAARGAARPDLGRRGYGCFRRDDHYADVTCISHEEHVGGVPTREIRMQFLNGGLQQLSLTADLPHLAAVVEALRAQHGAPQETRPAADGRYASWQWRNAVSTINAYAGKDVVFVSLELIGYAAAVERRKSLSGRVVVEPR